MMEKEKKMPIKYYLILILLLLSLFVALIYTKKVHKIKNVTKIVAKETKTEVKTEEVIIDEDLPLDNELVVELQQKIKGFDTIKAGSYYGYFYNQDYLDINGISDDAKIAIGITQNKNFSSDFINATYDAQAPDGTNLDVIILSAKEVQEGVNDFFGPNTSYKNTNLLDATGNYCGFSGFEFDDTRNVYMNNPFSCTGFPQDYIDTKLISAHQTNDKIELTIKIAYIKYEATSFDNVTKYVYRHLNDGSYIEKHDILNDNSYEITNILNQLDSFKFTFKLHSNNYYYFDKVEKIK